VDEKKIALDQNEGSLVSRVKSKQSNLDLGGLKTMLSMEYDNLVLELILKCVNIRSQTYAEVRNTPNFLTSLDLQCPR
jgi:hypothetical protein